MTNVLSTPILRVPSILHEHGVQALQMRGPACIVYGASECICDVHVTVLATETNTHALAPPPAPRHISRMPKPELLENFPNPYADRDYEIVIETNEFTSLCPLGGIESDAADLDLLKGGAPDFATIRLSYVPDVNCIELKSLKLYFWSFRNDGIFYERAVNRILDDLVAKVQPRRMTVVGDFNVRGGLKSVITAHWPPPVR